VGYKANIAHHAISMSRLPSFLLCLILPFLQPLTEQRVLLSLFLLAFTTSRHRGRHFSVIKCLELTVRRTLTNTVPSCRINWVCHLDAFSHPAASIDWLEHMSESLTVSVDSEIDLLTWPYKFLSQWWLATNYINSRPRPIAVTYYGHGFSHCAMWMRYLV